MTVLLVELCRFTPHTPNSYVKSLNSSSQNMTVCIHQAFKRVVKLKIRLFRWAFAQWFLSQASKCLVFISLCKCIPLGWPFVLWHLLSGGFIPPQKIIFCMSSVFLIRVKIFLFQFHCIFKFKLEVMLRYLKTYKYYINN